MNKSLHAMLVKIYTSPGGTILLLPLQKHPPTTSLNHCLVCINIQKALMSVSGCHFFCTEEFRSRPLLHMYFCIRCHSVRLPPLLPSFAQQQNITKYCWEGSASTAVLPAPASDVMGQQNKIGDITFRPALMEYWGWYFFSTLETCSQIPVTKWKAWLHIDHCSQDRV